jgi:ADP-ribose pyrophosphatase
MQVWRLIARRPGPVGFVSVQTNTYSLPDGTTAEWDILLTTDAVAVVALTPDGRVVLARQYRPGPDVILDEMPGGAIDAGEDVAAAAARELREETGFAGDVEVVGYNWHAANSTRKCWAAIARNCVKVAEPVFGHSEFCETVIVSLAEFRAALRTGQFTDTAVGYLALDRLGAL